MQTKELIPLKTHRIVETQNIFNGAMEECVLQCMGQLQNKKTRAIIRLILWLLSMLLSLKLLLSPAISYMRKRQDNLDNYRIAKSKGSWGDRRSINIYCQVLPRKHLEQMYLSVIVC